jgi:hypothetical protein
MAKKATRKKIKDLSPKKKASKVKGGARSDKITYSGHRW